MVGGEFVESFTYLARYFIGYIFLRLCGGLD